MAPRSRPAARKPFRPALDLLEDRLLPSVTVTVDAGSGQHPIDPNVYGVAYGTATSLADLNVPFNRYGGNNASRYNWQLNADNRGSDWYFESIGDSSATAGERGDSFISASQAAGAQADLTVPMIDWVAKLGANRDKLASFSVAKYGAQTATDPWLPDAGNGVAANGQNITGNDPNDANVPNGTAFEQGWVQHLVQTWGTAAQGGLQYYTLDNEPSLWQSTHRDVHPTGATMDEILSKTIAYASMIKAVDPTAQVIGPEEWGWSGYFYSGYDQQYGSQHGWSNLPDRAAHGGWDYLPWLLDQLRQHDAQTGQRLLDVFSVHYYPQGGEFGNDVSTAMQLLRNQSTRSLWDPNYVDQSWINDKVDLIPRLQNWVAAYYPGTRVGITEYNWGAEGHMNGATTQADILGIFGRQGLDLAARWSAPAAGTPTYNAFKMYRNYDGNKSTFGDTGVAASAPNPDQVSAFAALRSADGALTVMVVNKNLYDPNNPSATTDVTLDVSNFAGSGVAQVWQLLAPNPADLTASAIQQLPDVSYAGNAFTVSVPMQSVTLFVLQPAATGSGMTVTGKALTPAAGTAWSGVAATFTDANAQAKPSDFTATITWGDGHTSKGTVTTDPAGGFDVSGANTYGREGRFVVGVTVKDAAGHTAGASGMAHVARVGAPPANLTVVANAFTHGAEYYGDFITAAYQKYLGRQPDAAGLAAWVRATQNGLSDEWLEAGFIGSPEYIGAHGGPGAGWVRGMYQDLLGRTASQAEVNAWVAALQAGQSTTRVAYGFAASGERESQRVTADYQKYVGRLPGAAEVNQWVAAFLRGVSNENVAAGFLASDEYFRKHYDNIEDWLWGVFQDALNRPPDPAGWQTWLPVLQAG